MAESKELPEGAEAPKKKSRFKLIMVLLSLFILLGAGGGAGYWWFYLRPEAKGIASLFSSSKSGEQTEAKEAAGNKEATAGKEAGKGGATPSDTGRSVFKPVPLPPLMVNLADPQGSRYLKISMQVEVNSPDAIPEIEAQSARIRDALILLLSGKKAEELTTPEGKILLKNEVAARLNQVLGSPRIVRIYYTEFEIQ